MTADKKIVLDAPAPEFSLPDFNGREVRLSDYRGRNVLLVFNRSFTWPFCNAHLAQLRRDHAEFEQRVTEVLVLGPENAKAFSLYWKKHILPFTGLPDPGQRVLRLYGQEIKLLKLGRMPAQVLVDKNGLARFAHYGSSMSDIPENAELLGLIDKL